MRFPSGLKKGNLYSSREKDKPSRFAETVSKINYISRNYIYIYIYIYIYNPTCLF